MLKDELKMYAVTDRTWLKDRTLPEVVEDVLKGGATILQLREKNMCDDDFYAEGLQLKELCAKYGVPLIINDNVEVARRLGCGVHVGQNDMELTQVRNMLGNDVVIGVSCQTVADAIRAERDGADYLGVGAVFSTSTKTDADYVDYRELSAICGAVNIPVVAIGGIYSDNIGQLAGSGVDGVAVVSALFAAEDPCCATKELLFRTERMLAAPVPDVPGCIIDLDGTILDSLGFWDSLGRDYLRTHGVEAPSELENVLNTMELPAAAAYLHEKYGVKENADAVLKDLLREIQDIYSIKSGLMPGVREMLSELRSSGARMALFTSTERGAALAALRKNAIEHFFDCVITTMEHGLDKSTPEAYYYVLGRLGTSLEKTVVYEDAPYALAGAEKTGMKVVAVGR